MTAPLLPEHLADLQKSGLSDATIVAAQVQAVCPRDLQALGPRYQSVSSAYRIPYFHLDSTLSDFHRLKLFPAVKDRDGHTVKYHQPAGTDTRLYRPPLMKWGRIATDPAESLVITEGEKKALALAQLGIPCLGIGGLWSWRTKVDGERMTLPEFDTFRWESRRVELAPDSDVWDRNDLLKAVFALAMELVHRGALVSVVQLSERAGGKVGLDDFLVSERAWPLEAWQGLERVSLEDPRLKRYHAWYQGWKRRQTSEDVGLVKRLADDILLGDAFARDAGGQLYVFERGVYRPNGDKRVALQVKRLLELNGDTKRWSSHKAREVTEYIRVDALDLWELPPADVLNLPNGLLGLPSRTLRPHTPEHLSTVQLPVVYDPQATCPAWDAFLAQVMPEDCQGLAYELVALLMCPDLSSQQAVLCIGEGANGKSTFLAALTAFLGPQHVAGLSLQQLESDKFSVVRLLGKLANICPDLPSEHLASTSTFKSITGGDRLTGERKFQGSFEFLPFCRLVFSANHYPRSKDSSAAFFRRWQVIPFEKTFTPQQQTPRRELDARLAQPAELSGVLNRALDVVAGIAARGRLSQTESTQTAMREFQEMTDPLAAWLNHATALAPDGMVTKTDLHLTHGAHCKASEQPPLSSKAFYAGVKRLRPTLTEAQRTVHGRVQWVFLGLELTSSPSRLSLHSPDFSQISLEKTIEEEEGEKRLNRGNAVNAVKAVNEHLGVADPCFSCKGTVFWESIHGSMVCAACHPPINNGVVKQWIRNAD